jgi:hypothetical protein
MRTTRSKRIYWHGGEMKLIALFALGLVSVQVQSGQTSLSPRSTTTVCFLVDHATEYSGMAVRLQAKIVSGAEFTILRDDACPPKENPNTGKHDVVLATFDQDHFDFKCPLNKSLTKLLKHDGQAEIVAAGNFIDPEKYIGHQLCCRYDFRIRELINVKSVRKRP